MINLNELNETHLDFFKEIENIGASHAATALSKMLGRMVTLRVPSVKFYEFSEISGMLGGPENLVAGILVEMTDDLTGFILMVQDINDAVALSNSVITAMGMEPEESPDGFFTEMQLSSLQEISNILAGSYLSSISALTGLKVNASVPKIVIDMAGAIMNLPAATYGEYGDVVLFLETEFVDADSETALNGHFLLVPDVHSFATLLKTMGIA